MKLYVSVDMEGISGIPDHTYVDSGKLNYPIGRMRMTEETNAVIEAAHRFGCEEILINDSHSKMNNLLTDDLHPEASLITGDVKPFSMVQGLDDRFTGAMFVGYHARAAQFGVMSHSMTFGVRNFFINDVAVGELGLNAFVAGHFGVPILMVAGDDQACLEAEALIPNVVTAPVKKSISRSAVQSLTPTKANHLIQEQVTTALSNRDDIKPLTPPKKPTLRIEFTNYGEAEWANLMPGTSIEPGTTIVSFQAKDILEAYQAMLVMTELAMQTTFK
ncbi:M55 family metallopeptidase [Radiobacillus deserti]|uniref:M55 family metallopeptidase n=1 Tax=Radiobacillus deserti TaxID=2594883 RepID=A0A516KJQ3_9BACI|nr:M55 family metallopeptidase [Radiobacillus deserti]QDP41640.1 M55 family metallopeptidase [Radiobacillus deserti]